MADVQAEAGADSRRLGDEEGLEARFFEPEAIPWDELAFRSTQEALREFLGGPEGPPLRTGGPVPT